MSRSKPFSLMQRSMPVNKGVKNDPLMVGSSKPIVLVRLLARLRAATFGLNSRRRIVLMTRFAVSSATGIELFSTRLTVDIETPASLAISMMVGFLRGTDYSFKPVSLMPWIKVFWAKKNAMMIGNVKTTEAAINKFQATVRWLLKSCSPRAMVKFCGLVR